MPKLDTATEKDVALDVVAALDMFEGLMGSADTHVERVDATADERELRIELDNGQKFDLRVREAI